MSATAHPRRPSQLPRVIQGGMGIAVSNWQLANAVGRTGELGVVSAVALEVVLARRLGDGDPGGHSRRALAAFPFPDIAARVLDRWYVDGGRQADQPYKRVPRPSLDPSPELLELAVCGAFVEVWLAKEGHDGPIGANLLEKVQIATPASLYGAMLADVDYILMGAGIPAAVPGVLDAFSRGEAVDYRLTTDGAGPEDIIAVHFDPAKVLGRPAPMLKRPMFLAIISSHTLGTFLAKSAITRPDGFVVETAIAGGHNAPPRGKMQLDDSGQPVYGPRDVADLEALGKLGLPFWMAGGYGHPAALKEALAAGAAGVQVGTAFALCDDSGMEDELRKEVVDLALAGTLAVRTDPLASPSGFPFKVASVTGTVSESDVYGGRDRICDLGFLRTPYKKDDGTVGFRCEAEPVKNWVHKGRDESETVGRKCLCNGLMSTIGLGQVRRNGVAEPAIVTMGDDAPIVAGQLAAFVGDRHWSAADVVSYITQDV